MRTKLCVSVIALSLVVLLSIELKAQSDPDPEKIKRFEIGGQFTYLRRKDPDAFERALAQAGVPVLAKSGFIHEAGFGARFTFNLNRNIALEAEANYFPVDKQFNPPPNQVITVFEPGGRKFQMLFGPKIGLRKQKFGIFAKARPGFIALGTHEVILQVGVGPGGVGVLSEIRPDITYFAFDLGGVFEFYPSKRTVFRVDAGDTIINYRSFEPGELNHSLNRHNLQTSVGFGFRF